LVNKKWYEEHSNAQLLSSLFYGLMTIVILVRLSIFFKYNIQIIDSDQPYMWLGAKHFSEGLFYEPRFYGQDYNTFMEGFFAAPLLWFGVPVYYAVPIATHLIFLFPIFFTSIYLFKKNFPFHALIILAALLCLPSAFDLMTSLPRGFVTGLFFTSFFIVSILNPQNLKYVAINTFLAVLGFFVNQNSVLVSAPFLFFVFLHHVKNPRYYFATGFTLLSALPLYYFFNGFYTRHPDYVKNDLKYRISFDFFVDNISSLDERFAHLSFFLENNSLALIFSIVALMTVLAFQKKHKALAAMGIFLFALFCSFCVGKTVEGSKWVFISFSRLYLGIPFVLFLFFPLVSLRGGKKWLSLLIIPFCFSVYKIQNTEEILKQHFWPERWVGVRLHGLTETLEAIEHYKKQCDIHDCNFFVIAHGFWLNTHLAYGGPAIHDDYPITIESKEDKRYWVREKYLATVIPRFLMLSSTFDITKTLPKNEHFDLIKLDDFGLFLIENNKLPLEEVLRIIKEHEPDYK